jgi:peptidoglycan hydrolase-like protein with peptidoglycan-binding domain
MLTAGFWGRKAELMKRLMKPANLVLLSLLVAGVGLPVSFLQAGAPTTQTTKKKTNITSNKSGKTTSGKTTSSKTASSRRGKTTKGASSRREKGQKAPTAERVSQIQTALAKDGSFSGSPNGKWDDSTVAAMKKFQAGHGLNPSGKLDAKTLQQLGLGSQTAGVAPPTPPLRISSTSGPAPETAS